MGCQNPPNGAAKSSQALLKLVHGELLHLERWGAAKTHEAPEHLRIAADAVVHPFGRPCLARGLPL